MTNFLIFLCRKSNFFMQIKTKKEIKGLKRKAHESSFTPLKTLLKQIKSFQ